jgi:hypothetical protein
MAMTTVTARPTIRQAKRPQPPALMRFSRIVSKGFAYEFPFRFPAQ